MDHDSPPTILKRHIEYAEVKKILKDKKKLSAKPPTQQDYGKRRIKRKKRTLDS